jgi:hypothetical protein
MLVAAKGDAGVVRAHASVKAIEVLPPHQARLDKVVAKTTAASTLGLQNHPLLQTCDETKAQGRLAYLLPGPSSRQGSGEQLGREVAELVGDVAKTWRLPRLPGQRTNELTPRDAAGVIEEFAQAQRASRNGRGPEVVSA